MATAKNKLFLMIQSSIVLIPIFITDILVTSGDCTVANGILDIDGNDTLCRSLILWEG
jgi:hypothetical protein